MPTNWKMFAIIVGGFTFITILGGILLFWKPNHPTVPSAQSTSQTDDQSLYNPADYANATAIIETDKGTITMALYPDSAPKTVENFIRLANLGYYDGLTFHRVIADFMIQTGDPTGTGSGGESIYGTTFEDEINAKSLGLDQILVKDASFLTENSLDQSAGLTVEDFYVSQGYSYRADITSHKMVPGAVAMANKGPLTNTSQFFIVTSSDQPHLDGKHTVFGQVTEGLDIAQQIAQDDIVNSIIIVK
ncbi:hypothetical protein AUK40_00825 [Candidatus Wirthbacteria bacterium CG2_30_54_11]|uniref:Peptidyl-prolyl cis-trans isomerase n=1 Tax=Candidatus Wirthbacteria bacterium CG2_30_54_11 TaxID=1817892 RepID=A0A1J5IPR4_9BACT|nr:MAG: hypothetical protein AUK40_00825 [Candidatus Wirthbacteria bacterium CG2_30_54_11]